MSSASSTPLLSDRAANRDLLDFKPYTDTLLDIIRDPKTEGPLVIGVFGSWGSGKTSLMRFVQNSLAEPDSEGGAGFRLAWFDAWKYEKEDALWRALLLRVVDNLRTRDAEGKDTTADALRKDIERLEQRLYRDLKWEEKGGLKIDWPKAAKSAVKGAVQLSLGFIPGLHMLDEALKAASGELGKASELGSFVEAFRRDVVEHHQAQLRSIEQFQAEFGRLVATHVLGRQQRLVVFVDDLDRCLPEKAIEVLEAIKLFLDVPGCIFLLGLDQEVVTRGIKVKYRQFAVDGGRDDDRRIPIDGAAYLEKIIQLPFRLPKIEPRALKPFVTGLATFTDPRCADVFAEGLETNPRKVKRAINIFLFLARLAGKREIAIQPVRLAKIVVIYHSHPELYERLRLNPALLRVIEEYLRQKQPSDRAPVSKTGATQPAAEPSGTPETPAPPPVPAAWLTDDLKRVLLLFADQPEACFLEAEFVEVQSYFTLTRGAIAPVAAPANPKSASRPSLDFPVPTLVRIPAGEFTMGTSDQDIERLVKSTAWAREWRAQGRFKAEQPQFRMRVNEFLMGKHPVTNAEYRAFVIGENIEPPSHWSGGTFPDELAAHPVVNVSWHDARKYCEWLTQKLRAAGQLPSDHAIRLPAEAEWEMAARGPADARFYPWGNEWDPSKANTSDGGTGHTTPVGQYSPAGDSPFGLADMAGNVWEWCSTTWRDNYTDYAKKVDHDPEGEAPRVLRGGSWNDFAGYARCACRSWDHPDNRDWNFGFRVVASPFASGL